MPIKTYSCTNCDVEFELDYDDSVIEEEPTFCPFCGDIEITEEESQDLDFD